MIHLVGWVFILGPLYLRSMFPYEWFLAVLKAYVRNCAHPEGSIMDGKLRGRGRMGQKSFVDRDYNSVSGAHFSVLQQLKIAAPYIEEHLSELCRDNIGHTQEWIMKEHRRVFTTWLMDKEIPT